MTTATRSIAVSFIKDGHSTAPRLLVKRNDQQAGMLTHNESGWVFNSAGAPQADGSAEFHGRLMNIFAYSKSDIKVWAQLEEACFIKLNDALQALIQAEPRAAKRDTQSEANYLLQRFPAAVSEGLVKVRKSASLI